MANIMVNEICNLRCPYCFADEFVNRDVREMTLGDFKKALDFVLSDEKDRQVNIIGGEPLLYKHIGEALRLALDHHRSDQVMIFTNAVELERLEPEILRNPRFRMLVNCNSPEDIGGKAFEKMWKNLLSFLHEHNGINRFRLSVNIYKPDFDHSYVIPLVQELELNTIRMSISVPKSGDLKGKSPLEYFREMKPTAIRFIGDMMRCGAIAGFDCNFIPKCVFTKDEREGLTGAKEVLRSALSRKFSNTFWERVIFSEITNCSPVIDILPDLQAIRCFGLSEHTKQDIKDFRNIEALRKHYISTVDSRACNLATEEECKSCFDHELGRCSCGCLLFKSKELF